MGHLGWFFKAILEGGYSFHDSTLFPLMELPNHYQLTIGDGVITKTPLWGLEAEIRLQSVLAGGRHARVSV